MKTRTSLLLLALVTLAGCSSPPPRRDVDSTATKTLPAPAGDLVGHPWNWVATQTPEELLAPADPSLYTVQFFADSSTALRADCNRGRSTFSTTADGGLTIPPGALTRAMCPPGSLDTKYLSQLANTAHWFLRGDTLYIDLRMDSGTMRFARGPATSE